MKAKSKKVTKRNPYVVLVITKSGGGAHKKSGKAQRRAEKMSAAVISRLLF